MKKATKVTLSVLTALFSLTANDASAGLWNYYNPRLSIWGLAGEPEQVRGDFLFPVAGNVCNLFYADIQGSYTQQSNAWSNHDWSKRTDYVSAGAGFRKLYDNSVLGAYLFYDRDESNSHNIFNVLSPGVEGFFCNWDVRLNGYFPLNPRRKINSSLAEQLNYANLINPPCSCDIASIVQQSIFFHGHNEFFHAFTIFEEPGRGGDAEIGYTFHRLNNTQLHGGVYYFNFHTPSNFRNFHNNPNNLTGVEGRLETPLNRFVAITAEASYDKYQRGAVVGGLRVNLVPSSYSPCDLRSHMTDAIPRNLGTLRTGSGVPTIKSARDDGVFVARDNLYFFSATGGSAFVNSQDSGTFDNPLAANQWTQTTVDAIGPGADFVFPTGPYTNVGVGPTPNSDITLLLNDSIFGLSSSFQALPIGSPDRPTFLGSFTLPGFNTLAAIQVMNQGGSDGKTNASFTTLNIVNAPSVFLCNDNIVATSTVTGDLQIGISNIATGIFAQNSKVVTVQNTTVTANAKVTGDILANDDFTMGGFNFASGIGGSSAGTTTSGLTGNTFNIVAASTISGTASVAGTNNWDNFAVGIGANADNSGTANVTGNTFTIQNGSTISGTASAGTNNEYNFAAGIGTNAANHGSAIFSNNIFTKIDSSTVTSNATSNTNGFFQQSIGIGSNGDGLGKATFEMNTLTIQNNSQINSNATVTVENDVANQAVGIGTMNDSFIQNTFFINNSKVNATSAAGLNNSQNLSTGIGLITGTFNSDNFTLGGSQVTSTSSIPGNNTGSFNAAIGIGSNQGTNFGQDATTGNMFTLDNTSVTANATVGGNNLPTFGNVATGIGGFSDAKFMFNTFNLSNNSNVTANATVAGNNGAAPSARQANEAIGIGDAFSAGNHFTNNTFNIMTGSTVTGNATVKGNNNFVNLATGIGAGLSPSSFGGNVFSDNHFNLNFNTIAANATVAVANNEINEAVGIGTISDSFIQNTFFINNSKVNATSAVGLNNSQNLSTGIGLIIGAFNTTFNTNNFTLGGSQVTSTSSITGDNAGSANVAIGIGSNQGTNFGQDDKTGNTFNLDNTSVTANATVGGNNSASKGNIATGIGAYSDSNFLNNTFNLSNNSNVVANASVTKNNTSGSTNEGIGIGDSFALGNHFNDNTFNMMSGSTVTGMANVGINNTGTNLATGIGIGPNVNQFTGNHFNLNDNIVKAIATVTGSNAGGVTSAVGIGNNSNGTSPGVFAGNTITGLLPGDANIIATATATGGTKSANKTVIP